MGWGKVKDFLVFYFAPVSLETGYEFKDKLKKKNVPNTT